jgi:hypothetical protein
MHNTQQILIGDFLKKIIRQSIQKTNKADIFPIHNVIENTHISTLHDSISRKTELKISILLTLLWTLNFFP